MASDEHFPSTYEGLVRLVERLRGPDGCPWDREQPHRSLTRGLLEECYELIEAIEEGDPRKIVEELGDVLFHVDAAQAVGHVPIDFAASGADLLSVSAHKFGGPVGTGALLVRRGLRLEPLLAGGDQERARRAGLENTPAIIGFGVACTSLADGGLEQEAAVFRRLTDRLRDGLASLEGVDLFGNPDHRLPHLVCAGIVDVEPQAVLLGLDRAGVAAHSGSACASEGLEPSPVLEAMGVDADRSLPNDSQLLRGPEHVTVQAVGRLGEKAIALRRLLHKQRLGRRHLLLLPHLHV